MESATDKSSGLVGLVVRRLRKIFWLINAGLIAFIAITTVWSFFNSFVIAANQNRLAALPKHYSTSFVLGWIQNGGIRISWGTHLLSKEYSVEPNGFDWNCTRYENPQSRYAGYPYQRYTLLFTQGYQGVSSSTHNPMYISLDNDQSVSGYDDYKNFGFQYSDCWINVTPTQKLPVLQSVTFPLFVFAIPSVLILLWHLKTEVIRNMRLKFFPHQCAHCGYDLSGVEVHTNRILYCKTCPECGHMHT